MVFRGILLGCKSDSNRLTPRLIFHVNIENERSENLTILAITGEMFLKKGDRYLGLASLNTLFASDTIKPEGRCRFDLEVNLDFRQIEIIEEERKGDDVHFKLTLKVLYSLVERRQQLIPRFRTGIVVLSMPTGEMDLTIPQSEWVKMLEEIGYGRLRVIELPVPQPPEGTAIDSSLSYLHEALRSFNEGDYDDVLSNCRQAIEVVKQADLNLEVLLGSESKAEKILGIERKLNDFLNLGPHAGTRLDRGDAELALYATVSMIRYLAKRLEKKSS